MIWLLCEASKTEDCYCNIRSKLAPIAQLFQYINEQASERVKKGAAARNHKSTQLIEQVGKGLDWITVGVNNSFICRISLENSQVDWSSLG